MSFYTEVLQKSPKFHSLNQINDPAMLEPITRAAVMAIIADAAAQGTKIQIGETYRSTERQAILFNKGATKLKTVGVHHYGLAADLWIVKNGQVDWHADYRVLGPLAKKHGLIWGGDWGHPEIPHSFRDMDHVQRCPVNMQGQLFAGDWYPDVSYNPVGK